MKLKVTKAQLQVPVNGVIATIVRNDITGSVLVIEGGNNVLNLKISDLLEFITEEEKEKTEGEALSEVKNK